MPLDSDLSLIPVPDRLPLLHGPEGRLIEAGEARPFPVILAGRTAWAMGLETCGADGITLLGRTVVHGLQIPVGPSRRVAVAPGIHRRELVTESGRIEETGLVLPELPALVLQWRAPTANPSSELLFLSWEVPSRASPPAETPGPLRYRWEGNRLLVSDSGAIRVQFSLHGRSVEAEWRLEEREEGGLRIELRAGALSAEPLHLAVVGMGEDRWDVFSTLSHLRAQELRWGADVRETRKETLHLLHPDESDSRAVEWSKVRIRGMLETDGSGSPVFLSGHGPRCPSPARTPAPSAGLRAPRRDLAQVTLGALAAGLFPLATTLLRAYPLSDLLEAGAGTSEGGPEEAEAFLLELLARARHLLWTGDLTLLRREAGPARTLAHGIRPGAPPEEAGGPPGFAASVFEALGNALESAGTRAEAEAVRALAEEAATGNSSSTTRRPEGTRRLVFPPTLWTGDLPMGPTAAFRAWRGLAQEGFRASRGCWRPGAASHGSDGSPNPSSCPDHGATAALVPGVLVHGILGVVPDAPAGRLTLAPRFPPEVERFHLRGLRMETARVELKYRSRKNRHTFELEQIGGRIPVTAVFAPLLPIPGVAEVRVDGSPGEVEIRPRDHGTRIELQLPLDHPRRIDIDGLRP